MNLDDVIQRYARQHDLELEKKLGDGTDGLVYKTHQTTAIKAFDREKQFYNELGCYQRLQELECNKLGSSPSLYCVALTNRSASSK